MPTRRIDSTETSEAVRGGLFRSLSHCRRGVRCFARWGLAALCLSLAAMATACNTHPVQYAELTGEFEREIDATGSDSASLDVLWVIDNSASMCQEQDALGDEFEQFVSELDRLNADFNIAVTTTEPKNPLATSDPVATFGEIQSQPYPRLPAFTSCRFAYSSQGVEQTPSNASGNWGNFQPLRNQIQKALNCTKNPEQEKMKLRNEGLYAVDSNGVPIEPSDRKLACATNTTGQDGSDPCESLRNDGMGGLADRIEGTINSGFGKPFLPTPFYDKENQESPYVDIPKVLSADDYRQSDGSLRSEELRQDFSCMSFVGVSGSTYEMGLKSAARAISPEKTGGAADFTKEEQDSFDPDDDGESEFNADAPNHGFLRQDARFATVFVTDENDCSTSQDISSISQNGCGDTVCYFPTKNDNQDPLDSTDELYATFMENLRKSKGMSEEEFSDYQANDVYVASIHGTADKSTVDPRPDSCMQNTEYVRPTCTTQFGVAFTGDRYQDFLLNFPADNRIPSMRQGQNNNGPLRGWVCQGTLADAINSLREIIPNERPGCITADVRRCDSNGDGQNDCPDYRFGDAGSGSGDLCQDLGQSGRQFCDSSIRVELDASGYENPEEELSDRGYCLQDSIGATPGLENRCVVDRSRYTWVDCGDEGIRLSWNNATEARQRTSGMEVRIRFHEARTESDGGPDAMSGTN